jgi:hypothetical protein
MAIIDTIKNMFATTKDKVLAIFAIIGVICIMTVVVFIIIYLAKGNKTLVFWPSIKVIDIENPEDKNLSQKSIDEAVRLGKEIYNKIKG